MRAEIERIRLHERALSPFPQSAPLSRVDSDLLPTQHRTSRWFAAIKHWLEMLAIVVLALALALLIGKAVGTARYEAAILRYPFQIDDAEGVILSEATLIAHGTDPYAVQPSPAHHFYAGPYTPLYTVINTAMIKITGPMFAGGRAVQLLATLAVAAWLAWAIGRSAGGPVAWMVGVWAALLFLTWHLVAHWSVMVRPDMTAAACNLAGVALLRRWWNAPGREGWRAARWPQGRALGMLALGATCFALGWWTKQTFVVVPLAFILMLLPYRPKVAVTLASLYTTLVGLSLGILTLLTGGGFIQKTYFYQLSWTWHAYLFLARPFTARYGLLPALALLAAICICVRQRRLTFGACWLALAALQTLTAGTDGGNHNHFVELLAAATLALGQGVAVLVASAMRGEESAAAAPDRRHLMHARRAVPFGIGLAAILLLTGVAVGEQEGRRGWLARDYRLPTVAERQGFEQAASAVASTVGPAYGDNVGLGILAITDHAVSVTDPFTLAAEVRMGRWDDSALVDDVAAGRYRLIALRGDVAAMDPMHPPGDVTPGLIRAIRQHYHPVERNVVWLYAPNAPAPASHLTPSFDP
ncbi:MAG: hypothetical protein ACR2M3_02980 [Thermomicrobiales bacterium]